MKQQHGWPKVLWDCGGNSTYLLTSLLSPPTPRCPSGVVLLLRMRMKFPKVKGEAQVHTAGEEQGPGSDQALPGLLQSLSKGTRY